MHTTRKGNPYRDTLWSNRDYCIACKGSLTILKVNLCSLTLWSNQGNRGINLDHHMVMGGKPILLNLWCNLSSLVFRLVKMLHSQGHIMVLL